MLRSLVALILLLAGSEILPGGLVFAWAPRAAPRSLAASESALRRRVTGFGAAAVLAAATAAVTARPALAVSGSVQKASLEETQAAARQLLSMAKDVEQMEKLGAKGDWEGVATILSSKAFVEFDATANVLVRSDSVSAEDKVALGTIKRYGVVADAIIMMGGLGSVLRAGGVKSMAKTVSAYADQKAIIDDEADEAEEEDEERRGVNEVEATKYIKLVKGSLADINRIVAASKIL